MSLFLAVLSCRARPGNCPARLRSASGRFVHAYCDDILIISKTRDEHLVHVRMVTVLETLLHHKPELSGYAKASKCQFGRASESVGFPGHVIISEHGVAVDPSKVASVAEWARATPTSPACTDVHRSGFVGVRPRPP